MSEMAIDNNEGIIMVDGEDEPVMDAPPTPKYNITTSTVASVAPTERYHPRDEVPSADRVRPKLSWTDTVIISFNSVPVPVECVANARESLNKRLSLRDKFGIREFTHNLNTNNYKHSADLLNDLLRLCFKIDSCKNWMIKRPVPFTGNRQVPNAYVSITQEELRNELTCGRRDVWDCLQKNRYMFMCDGLTFNSNIKGYKNVFEGWCYDVLEAPNYDLIALTLNHIKTYICGGDEAVYSYVIRWLSYILKYAGKKTETALVLIGPQGCGKNIFTNQIAQLMSPYSNRNIDDINEICGQWNGILENLCLAVCNELKSDKRSKKVDSNKLKGVVSEKELRIKRKYIDNYTAENVCSFIFISNNFSPFKQEIDDRRNLDLQCIMPDNADEYFTALGAEVDAPLYLQTLFTYLMNQDVPIDYDFVHNLPMTQLKQAIQTMYKNPFEMFITRHWQLFVDGWDSKTCKECANKEVIDIMEPTKTEYGKKGLMLDLQKYCGGAKQVRRDGDKPYVYKLLPNYVEQFKPTDEQIFLGEVDQINPV
jgi:energy-coupling factor transporter ATP-binding protein EcfA2